MNVSQAALYLVMVAARLFPAARPYFAHSLSQALFILYESASGYALFNVTALDEIGQNAAAVQDSVTELTRFSKVVHLEAFKPFASAADALEQINAVSEGEMAPFNG